MERNAKTPAWPEWIGLGGRAVIGFAADGGHCWKDDSHPALAPEQLLVLLQAQCTELERAIGGLDLRLSLARERGDDEMVDLLLDQRSRLSRRLRALRSVQTSLADMDKAA